MTRRSTRTRHPSAELVGVLAVVAVAATCGCAPRGGVDGQALYAAVWQASVVVMVNGRHRGSGFLADPEGLVVTAAHMVKGQTKDIEVLSPVAGRLKAERLAIDLGHDVALLRIPKRDAPYPTLPVAEQIPPPGSQVLLFGDPVFRHRLLLAGCVAAAGPRYDYSPGTVCYTRIYYVAGTSPEGTSGGCWVDRRGRVVGVQSGYLNNAKKAPAGIATVAPPDAIHRLLATRTSAETATLGTRLDELWTQPHGFIARFPKGTTGIVTVVPQKDGPVAKAGLTKESLITAIDGQPVAYIDELMALIRAKRPGDPVTLDVLDPGKKPKRTVTVRLADAKD